MKNCPPRPLTFSFASTRSPTSRAIVTLADDIVIHYNSTPPAKILEQLKREFVHPELERIATLAVAGQSVRVYGIYIPGGDHSYVAEVVRGGTVIFMELLSPTRRE